MFKRIWCVMVVAALVLMVALPVLAQADTTDATVAFLLSMQNVDGGFTNGYAPESDVSTTADVVIAAIALGEDPQTFFVGDMMNPFSYLGMQVQSGSLNSAGQLAKVLSAVSIVGKDWNAFAGHDLAADLLALQNDEGLFGFGAFDHCLAMIGLQNAGVELPENTVEALLAAQNEDGGWGFMDGEASDTNTTSLCLQALALTDVVDENAAGFSYLDQIQNEDGGWPYQNPSDYGTDSDSNSTALVVEALLANGLDLAEWNNPQDWLATMANDDGSYSYQPGLPGDVLSTVAVVPAVEGLWLNAWATVIGADE